MAERSKALDSSSNGILSRVSSNLTECIFSFFSIFRAILLAFRRFLTITYSDSPVNIIHEEHLLVLLLGTGWIISLVFKDGFHPSARLFFAAVLIDKSVIRDALSTLATPTPI